MSSSPDNGETFDAERPKLSEKKKSKRKSKSKASSSTTSETESSDRGRRRSSVDGSGIPSEEKNKKKRKSKLDPDGLPSDESIYSSAKSLTSTRSITTTEGTNASPKKDRKRRHSVDPDGAEASQILKLDFTGIKEEETTTVNETEKDETMNSSSNNEEEKDKVALATIGEVFSFAETTKTKVYIGLGLFFAMISGCTLPASIFFFSEIMGEIGAVAEQGLDPIIDLVYTMMVLGVVSLVSETMQSAFLETAANEMTLNLKLKWFQAVVRQDMSYFDLYDVSGTATIISTNGAKFKKGLSAKLGQGVQFSCTVLCGFGLAFWGSWRVTLVVLAVVPVMAGVTGWVLKLNQSKTARDNAAYAKAGSVVYQVVSSIRTVLALNATEEVIEKFTESTQVAYDGAVSQLTWIGIANGSLMSSFNLSYVGVIWYGSYLLYDAVATTGCDPSGAIETNVSCNPSGTDIFMALMGVIFAGATLPQVSTAIEAFAGARAACFPALLAMSRQSTTGDEQQDELILEKSQALQQRTSSAVLPAYKIDISSNLGFRPHSVIGTIEFKNVEFVYPTRKETQVFEGFNLKIPAGKTVALVGPSGSGKSTTVQLIERFYDPTHGTISLDGVDLKDINVSWLRQQIGLVSQEPKLFATTIKENIAIAKPGATQREIESAARRANAHDFIVSLQKGYDTHVGDAGAQLSGGQKQRIAIARTLITDPKIILLDEATSALDSESEAVVQEALDVIMAKGNVTVVVIAHRLSTIRNADIIAVVDKGKVCETGTHKKLIKKKGKYYQLVEAQKGKLDRRQSTASTDSESETMSRSNSVTSLEGLEDEQGSAPENGVVSLSHVHFTYPSRPDNKIFRDLLLSVQDGETLAIVGPSGQGKSTIIQLVEEFYRPSHGVVAYNGDDLRDLNVRWYRNEVGLVSQEPTLFDNTTIGDNIKFGMPEATQRDIEQAARDANAHTFITQFPDGYDTMVGTASSSQISGGQKQRIAIARALLRKPKVLLLDEATSALDTESEKVVQQALDKIMTDKKLVTIVIAHRLSTIRGADKIAYVSHGKVREIGTYNELMAKPNGHYKRLESLQTLGANQDRASILSNKKEFAVESSKDEAKALVDETPDEDELEKKKAKQKENERRARSLAKDEYHLFAIGAFGAILNGLTFPGQGFVFAYMLEVFVQYTLPCEDGVTPPPFGHATCQDYYDSVAQDMKEQSHNVLYLLVALILCTLVGSIIMFKAFGTATERINKRVRDETFKALVRQEVAWFDVRSVGEITTQLSDDAAMIHAFSGEPIRTFTMTIASVGVGLVTSFYFMWQFAFVALGILPFMAFGEYMQNQQMIGTGADEGDPNKEAEAGSEGAVVVETLLNMRTVAALCMEDARVNVYSLKLHMKNEKSTLPRNAVSGVGHGLGSFFQMWGYALMFYFGSWLLINEGYSMRDYFISLFALMLSLTGLAGKFLI
jgi:ATP-binding cassette subfamily B (MDR/TAP) protein 1